VSDNHSILAAELTFAYPRVQGYGQRPVFRLECPRWEVTRGARVALNGPSGCGNSTLLNLVAGMLRPSRGTLDVEGRELKSMSDAERRAHRIQKIGFVFQDFPLVDYLNAEENVLFPYRLNRALHLDATVRDRARYLLDYLGIADQRLSRPAELSQGEQQRVAIARSLVTDPVLLLADEPTAGLDPERSKSVMDLLESLSADRGLTLVMVTHDPATLARFNNILDVRTFSETSIEAR
jgi:putative ABC transport system ATP-binding protein